MIQILICVDPLVKSASCRFFTEVYLFAEQPLDIQDDSLWEFLEVLIGELEACVAAEKVDHATEDYVFNGILYLTKSVYSALDFSDMNEYGTFHEYSCIVP